MFHLFLANCLVLLFVFFHSLTPSKSSLSFAPFFFFTLRCLIRVSKAFTTDWKENPKKEQLPGARRRMRCTLCPQQRKLLFSDFSPAQEWIKYPESSHRSTYFLGKAWHWQIKNYNTVFGHVPEEQHFFLFMFYMLEKKTTKTIIL